MSIYHFESPIEERLALVLFPTMGEHVTFGTQRVIHTGAKKYRVDFHFNCNGRLLVVETDGRDFHDQDVDRERDTDLLLHGNVHSILRFRGCDVFCADQECVSFVHAAYPDLADKSVSWHDEESLRLLKLEMHKLKVKPILRTKLERRLIELRSADIDGKFHAKSNTAQRMFSESEAEQIQKIISDEFGAELA